MYSKLQHENTYFSFASILTPKGKKTKFPTFRHLFIEECMTKPKLPLQDRILLENLLSTFFFFVSLIDPKTGESSFNDTVTFDRFCYVVGWFGPMEPGCSAFFARVCTLALAMRRVWTGVVLLVLKVYSILLILQDQGSNWAVQLPGIPKRVTSERRLARLEYNK
jgi:hypothetical protein